MRSAEFDRDQVLRSAMNEFIAKGYTKTSMQDLKRATGLHPGSIYCAFENKRGLLIAALNHYARSKATEFEVIFDDSADILAGFRRYFAEIGRNDSCCEVKGCLLQKSLIELEDQDDEVEQLIRAMLEQWKRRIRTKLEQARCNQEIPAEADCEFLSDYVMFGIYGLRSFAQTHPEADRVDKLVNSLMNTLQQTNQNISRPGRG